MADKGGEQGSVCSQKGIPLFPFSPKGETRTSQVNYSRSKTAASPPRNYTKQDILYNSGKIKSKRLKPFSGLSRKRDPELPGTICRNPMQIEPLQNTTMFCAVPLRV